MAGCCNAWFQCMRQTMANTGASRVNMLILETAMDGGNIRKSWGSPSGGFALQRDPWTDDAQTLGAGVALEPVHVTRGVGRLISVLSLRRRRRGSRPRVAELGRNGSGPWASFRPNPMLGRVRPIVWCSATGRHGSDDSREFAIPLAWWACVEHHSRVRPDVGRSGRPSGEFLR